MGPEARTIGTPRPPVIAAAGVVLVAAGVIAVILLADRRQGAPPPGDNTSPTAVAWIGRLATTSNLYARPARASELVAVIPAGHEARVTGRTDDVTWLRVVYPQQSNLEGWVPRANFVAEGLPDLATMPALAPEAVSSSAGASGSADADTLPDLSVASADVQSNGNLAVRITNDGRAPFAGRVGLQISGADGEIHGVLDVDLTERPLAPGRFASVNTGIAVRRTGLFVIEIDRANTVKESGEFNNVRRVLLVGTGGTP
ncbi:MAG: SH3 domain-containing protein [Dehalococcoidia bacterium]|nr:SH3 domain-containing protein [Dehalococcoidia bacterium]